MSLTYAEVGRRLKLALGVPDALAADEVARFYSHVPNILLFTFVASTILLLYVDLGVERWNRAMGWWTAMQAVSLYRLATYLKWKRHPPLGDRVPIYFGLFACGTLATGATWAWFSLDLFPHAAAAQRPLIALVVVTLAAGSVIVLSLVRWLVTAFLVLLIVPLAAMFASSGEPHDLLMASLGAVMFIGMGSFSRVVRQNALRALESQLRYAREATRASQEQEQLSGQLDWLASRDHTTGLLNRDAMMSELHRHGGRGDAEPLACHLIQLLRLDALELHGSALSNGVMCAVATRLRQTLPPQATLARWSQDSFLVLAPLPAGNAREELEHQVLTLRETLREPMPLESGMLTIDFALGASAMPQLAADADMLVYQTAAAVHQLRRLGMGGARVFDPAADNLLKERQALRPALLQALQEDSFHLMFQPIEPASSQRPRKMEALLRWTHPVRGPISPAEFIPIAEESGLIVPLGSWVLQHACAAARRWPDEVVVCVNVSVQQILAGDLCVDVTNALHDSGLAPKRLEIEITESVFASDLERITRALAQLRELGVGVSIDDFGTGYSSLAYIRRLPVDTIKIDRSFVHDTESGGRKLLFAIVTMARGLGFHIVAEGVETEQQRELLLALGVDYLQGYLLGRPSPAHEVDGWLARTPSTSRAGAPPAAGAA